MTSTNEPTADHMPADDTQREREIVGHKTFATGETCPETGMPKVRHELLTRAEADAIWTQVEAEKQKRAADMPDEKAALLAMHQAWQRLKELGWREAMYCPKDGSRFQAIEAGGTGIHECFYTGEWPKGRYNIADAGDLWPSHPILFKLYTAEQAAYDARMASAREKYLKEANSDSQ